MSFKLTGIGPVFMVLGALASTLPSPLRVAGKAVFYFGLIFFALDLISTELKPLRDHPAFLAGLALARQPWPGVLIGIGFTALVQSSSVTTGVAILLVQQGALPPESAIPITIGANVGSTSTALVAGLGMGGAARAAAIANFGFNGVGMLLFLPFLAPFAQAVVERAGDAGLAVAWAHLVFNLAIALLFLLTLDFWEARVRQRLIGSGGSDRLPSR